MSPAAWKSRQRVTLSLVRYIADFYNKIIGHVEVPLNHPGRDRVRGRIWRVVYKGDGRDKPVLSASPDLRAVDVKGLIAAFDHPVLGVRMRAADELAEGDLYDLVAFLLAGAHQQSPSR